MKSVIQFTKFFLLGALFVASVPFVFAQSDPEGGQSGMQAEGGQSNTSPFSGAEGGQTGQDLSAEGGQSGPSKTNVPFIRNPLKSDINTLPALIEAIIDLLLWVAVPVVVLIIIWVGFQFVLAQGNESKLTAAKTALWYALIGIAVLFGAKVIASIVENTVGSILR